MIKNIQQSDMATYTCIASNKLGTLKFSYYLAILENMPLNDIDVVKLPENQTAHVGDTVTFTCRSRDWPKPPVYWTRTTRAGKIIAMLEFESSSEFLVVHNVTKDHAGVYTCFIGSGSNLRKLDATLTVIDQDERLPFEPRCSLHVRRQIMEDHTSGCKTERPVDIHYCMGSCGRSYSIPQIVSSRKSSSLNQTCSCCAGVMEKLRFVTLKCPLGERKRGFYTLLSGCSCRPCTPLGDKKKTLTMTSQFMVLFFTPTVIFSCKMSKNDVNGTLRKGLNEV
ncbi:fibroblast growth factor receptor [Elysia marginata]|uniref:Fibroblast growth factor receptor n=1 Tax=Elysia marginata TaxID=1093978 RepID=A0AAV4IX67_9GAST|nr:fibroblast growth factor receptor [Elysia marginata]